MKLKSLTLVGFKSFADKTTLDFHDGVTCVVGPNGCGKSNIIDAFKWVLGEQSAKSLRGEQMQDVIFSGTAQRRSAGFAEICLTFEDVTGSLGKEFVAEGSRSVSIARRLYRSGESEYLINKKPARLKDIREMFLDTGVGVDAYSLIEQGRVEMFLQSSPGERRIVFDEAAGISRYKVRKREASRRLERVEQNLLRLMDILAEVQKRLRSIKYQAGKARSYQAHTTRLKELRSLFTLAEYHRLSSQRQEIQAQADALADALAALSSRVARLQTARTASEAELTELERAAHEFDGRILAVSGEITTCQQRSEMLAGRARELADEIASEAARCEKLEARAEANAGEAESRKRQQADLEAELAGLSDRHESLAQRHLREQEAVRQLANCREDEKNGTLDLLRRTAELHNEINTYSIRRENLHSQRQRLSGRAEEIARGLEDLLAQQGALRAKLREADGVIADSTARLEQARRQSADLDGSTEQARAELSQAERRHSALLSRQAVLEEMQRRLEGVGEGVRRLLTAAREGRATFIRGMLGDFIETDVVHAGVITAALAEAEQSLLADRLEDVLAAAGQLKEMLSETDGVELICLDQLPPESGDDRPVRPDGVTACAADLVRCDADAGVARLVKALLGRTLVVESLARAAELARDMGPSWRFVTVSGEVLEGDGHVRIGSGRSQSEGVVWRKSELADLARKLQDSDRQITALAARTEALRSERAHVEEQIHAFRTAVYEANTERVEHQSRLERLSEQVAQLRREAPVVAEELRQLAEETEAAVHRGREAQEAADKLEVQKAERDRQIALLAEEHEAGSKRLADLGEEVTAARVALAEVRQRHDAVEETILRLAREGEAVAQELSGVRQEISAARQRREEAERGAAEARERIRQLVEQRAALTREAEENAESRRGIQEKIEEIASQLAEQQAAQAQRTGELGDCRVRLGEVEVRIESQISRTADELGMDLLAAYGDYTHDEQRDWEAVKQEIAELRGKIERLGNVNLDAIAEQDELQQRESFLAAQVEDIRASQRQLSELIKRINVESRRRFEESFQAVRANFNELFRKLFGGGKADILLNDPENVLESGIEIVARPPGKDLRSISLLSGGEKTMTALALLFSFFKCRPSPFCLLDEVDAALDEANTQRFVVLVREFLGTSQFIIITHAKRTIAMADEIYGVTMQEPGVSKRISVRFDQAAELAEVPGEAIMA